MVARILTYTTVVVTLLSQLADKGVLAVVPQHTKNSGGGTFAPVNLVLQEHTAPLSQIAPQAQSPILRKSKSNTPASLRENNPQILGKSGNYTYNADKGRYFTLSATVDDLTGNQNFSLLLDIGNCYSFIRSTKCTSPSDSFSCTGPKWNVSGLTEDNQVGSSYFYHYIDFNTVVYFDTYFAQLNVGGLIAKNISLGGSTESYQWYSAFGDGALALCNPAYYQKFFPALLNVEWFYDLGLTGTYNRFAIYLPKIGAGKYGELTIGGTNSARYKGAIQWVNAITYNNGYGNWEFNSTSTHISLGNSFSNTPSTYKIVFLDMGYNGIWFEEPAYNGILKSLNAVYDAGLQLNIRNYIEPSAADNKKCIPLINKANNDVYFVLGLPFMKQYYSILDAANQKVGFATSVQNYGLKG
ncbi:hypothetical protein HDU76_003641 [Blyttiomyces sp. JEL0837]|nr:hypothetical protein HDU76_003641 [Blyttiomyces sp. JEL0837]